LQDSEAQERCAGDLQEPAPQTAPGLKIFNDLAIKRISDFKNAVANHSITNSLNH
jgi:hypothetical protein